MGRSVWSRSDMGSVDTQLAHTHPSAAGQLRSSGRGSSHSICPCLSPPSVSAFLCLSPPVSPLPSRFLSWRLSQSFFFACRRLSCRSLDWRMSLSSFADFACRPLLLSFSVCLHLSPSRHLFLSTGVCLFQLLPFSPVPVCRRLFPSVYSRLPVAVFIRRLPSVSRLIFAVFACRRLSPSVFRLSPFVAGRSLSIPLFHCL